ncbi:fibroblast growth factor receptor 2-like [Montipora foliosa]|uniref:fibroblast growth factor receptor 2-like n=1 Tax=Montipora foliosa TaxID=591990 RepID=UPI0035F1CAFC
MSSTLFCMLVGILLFCPESGETATTAFNAQPLTPSHAVEGDNFTLEWTYTLDGGTFVVAQFFNGTGSGADVIGRARAPGSISVEQKYEGRFRGEATNTRAELTIIAVQRSDEGAYRMNVVPDGSGNLEDTVEIFVQYPPSNIVTSSVQVLSLYDELSLNCLADGRPKPTITWTRLSDSTRVIMPFNISSTQYGGYYRCTAGNGVGRSLTKDVFINVLFPPVITIESKLFVGREQTALLNCEVEGNPTPWIHWTPCDLPSIGCDKQFLNISKVQTSRANYTCTASNYVGNHSETTLLIIGGTNIFISLSTSGECDEKDSVWGSLQNELAKVFANTQSYIGAELIADIRCGSLIFDVVLKFNSQTAEDVIISTIKNAIVDGMLGELMVNASSIVGIPPVPVPTTRPPLKTTPKPASEKCTCSCTLFVIVTVILAAINIGLTAYNIWLHRRGTGRQKRAYQESSYENATENTPSVEMGIVEYQVRPTSPNDVQGGQYAPLNPSTRSWEIPRDHVTIEKIIGKGAFGQVAKATADGLRGMPQKTLVAVKMLKVAAPDSDKKDLLSELEVMKTLKPHPHVIKLIGCVTQSEPFLVLIEYVPYGDLLGYLRKSRGLHDTYYKDPDIKPQTTLTSQQLMKFSWQIADGMKYLSSRSIIHRDLAARNVLVGERETCKVTDFGMARDVQQENIYERKTKGRLPVKWTAYEALMYGTYTTKSDVWSFGVLLYEIFTIGGSPYPRMDGRKITNLLREGYRMPKPQHVDNELYKIMMSCWLEDPIARPTFLNLKDKLKKMENQHKRLINMDIYDNTQLYANVEDLGA